MESLVVASGTSLAAAFEMALKKSGVPNRVKATQSAGHLRHRKLELLTKGQPSSTFSIADAVTIKSQNLYLVCLPNGNIPVKETHGFGFYQGDCRFLDGYQLKIGDRNPVLLASGAEENYKAVFRLTNPDLFLRMRNGEDFLEKQSIGILWERVIDPRTSELCDTIELENYTQRSIQLPISIGFRARFDDIFKVRGLIQLQPGKLLGPKWAGDSLVFQYEGADGFTRCTRVTLSFEPDSVDGNRVLAHVHIAARSKAFLRLTVAVEMHPIAETVLPFPGSHPRIPVDETEMKKASESFLCRFTEVKSNSLVITQAIQRSLRDLRMLASRHGENEFFAAGIPWFCTLFGRDSLITGIQTLAFDPSIAEATLRVLAHFQGKEVNEWRDEEPGKILHEMRSGELARIGEIPHSPYYGTVDATPLFLILMGLHSRWTGSLSLFQELRGAVESALEWMHTWGDQDRDGFIEYRSAVMPKTGLINQGWKDSGNAVVTEEGLLVDPPVAMVEVQAYAAFARELIGELMERNGELDRAALLKQRASSLRTAINERFWDPGEQTFGLARYGAGMLSRAVASNAGHVLWAEAADPVKAAAVARRLMAEDMFSGWGVRTLSTKSRSYNPIGYHLGTVWPHDTSLIAAGFKKYGLDFEAMSLFTGLVEAAMNLDQYRLPELFAGFPRSAYAVPVRYPVACHPQAWAAGSIPFLLQAILGIRPNGFEGIVRIERPMLPSFADFIELRGLRVGRGKVDLRFERKDDGQVAVKTLGSEGGLRVET